MTREQCVLGGFSQGGFLALATALRAGAPRYAGVWAMCCAHPRGRRARTRPRPPERAPSALLQVGDHDVIIPPERGRAAAATPMRDAGWQVTEAGYDMGHSQRIEMMIAARAWLSLDLTLTCHPDPGSE